MQQNKKHESDQLRQKDPSRQPISPDSDSGLLKENTEREEKRERTEAEPETFLEAEQRDYRDLYPLHSIALTPYLLLWEKLGMEECLQDNIHNPLPFNLNKYLAFLCTQRIFTPSSTQEVWKFRNESVFDFSDIELRYIPLALEELAKRIESVRAHLASSIEIVFGEDGKNLYTDFKKLLEDGNQRELEFVLAGVRGILDYPYGEMLLSEAVGDPLSHDFSSEGVVKKWQTKEEGHSNFDQMDIRVHGVIAMGFISLILVRALKKWLKARNMEWLDAQILGSLVSVKVSALTQLEGPHISMLYCSYDPQVQLDQEAKIENPYEYLEICNAILESFGVRPLFQIESPRSLQAKLLVKFPLSRDLPASDLYD